MRSQQGFWYEEGAYEEFARALDPLGDDVRATGSSHIAPHVALSGDSFSMLGDESGFAGAYSAKMRELHGRLDELGGKWHRAADASRTTSANFATVESEERDVVEQLRGDLG